jgi:hypothetical protein
MARRTSLYLSEPLEAILAGRQDQDSLSGRLTTVAERYAAIVSAHRPQLSEAEWNACRDALNGVWLRDVLSVRAIWAEIADADRIDGLGDKWSIDGQALAARIRDMPLAAQVALVEAVETWWAAQRSPTSSRL